MFNNRAPHQILIDHYSSICMFISEAVYFSNKIVQNQDFVQKDFRPESKTEMKGPSKFINNPSIAMVQVWEAKILLPPPLTHLTYMSRLKLIWLSAWDLEWVQNCLHACGKQKRCVQWTYLIRTYTLDTSVLKLENVNILLLIMFPHVMIELNQPEDYLN